LKSTIDYRNFKIYHGGSRSSTEEEKENVVAWEPCVMLTRFDYYV